MDEVSDGLDSSRPSCLEQTQLWKLWLHSVGEQLRLRLSITQMFSLHSHKLVRSAQSDCLLEFSRVHVHTGRHVVCFHAPDDTDPTGQSTVCSRLWPTGGARLCVNETLKDHVTQSMFKGLLSFSL